MLDLAAKTTETELAGFPGSGAVKQVAEGHRAVGFEESLLRLAAHGKGSGRFRPGLRDGTSAIEK